MSNNELNYLDEKLTDAVRTLATGTGRIQQRLRDAYVYNLVMLNETDFPKTMRRDFQLLSEAVSRVEGDPMEGAVAASTREMKDEEAAEWARLIVSLQVRISRQMSK
jgi:hypothetical protein